MNEQNIIIQFPSDTDEILQYAENHGWVITHNGWKKDGYKHKTTEELYNYIKKWYKVFSK